MENLADELDAIAGEPEPDPAEQIRRVGERLVDALRDQLADGQVETLYSLQTASAQLRAHATSVTGATTALADSLKNLTERALSEVQSGFAALLREAQTSIGEQLAAEVDASSTELRSASQEHAQTIATQLASTSEQLTSLYDGAAARAEDARQGLEWVAQQGGEQLAAAAATLQSHRAEGEAALTSAGEQLAERVRSAATTAQAGLEQAVDGALQHLRDGVQSVIAQAAAARDELDNVLLEARKQAEEELTALRKQIQAAERREEAVAERLQELVVELVARTDATVGQSLGHLRAVADALLERDAQLEQRRADEFARVLQTVLAEGGASTRRLRDRIFRGMESAKSAPPVAAAPPPPRPDPAEAPVRASFAPRVPSTVTPSPATSPAADEPTVTERAPDEAPDKAPDKAAPKKTPTRKPAAKKAPASKTPASKTPASKAQVSKAQVSKAQVSKAPARTAAAKKAAATKAGARAATEQVPVETAQKAPDPTPTEPASAAAPDDPPATHTATEAVPKKAVGTQPAPAGPETPQAQEEQA